MAFKFKAKQHLSRLFLCSFLCFLLLCIPVWPWLTLSTLSLISLSLGSSIRSLEKREKAFWKCGASGGNWRCLGKQEKIFWECEASGRETRDVWKKKKRYSGNAELVETGDIQDNREKAFWKCRASGGNRGECGGKLWMSGKPEKKHSQTSQFPTPAPLIWPLSGYACICVFLMVLSVQNTELAPL